jgi:hypothetical protein
MRGETMSGAAACGRDPQIAGVGEDDLIAINVGEAQEFGLRGSVRSEKKQREGKDEQRS